MRKVLMVICSILYFCPAFSQDEVRMYRTETGLVYNQKQFDSIRVSGAIAISLISRTESGDTTFTDIKIAPIEQPVVVTKYEDTVLPELVFSDLQGKKYNTNDLKGHALYINFWSTSCGPCIAEMPDLSQLKKRYEKKKILFIGIAPDPADELQRFLKEHPFDFIIVSSDEIFQLLGIDSYPVNFFVDKKGVIKKVSTGTPVKKNPDTGKWEVSVIENYSKILDQLM